VIVHRHASRSFDFCALSSPHRNARESRSPKDADGD
jgi:hypothetical protein